MTTLKKKKDFVISLPSVQMFAVYWGVSFLATVRRLVKTSGRGVVINRISGNSKTNRWLKKKAAEVKNEKTI